MNAYSSWIAMALMLAASGFFSASETALFTLEPKRRAAAGPRVVALLERPRDLLVTILLGNLVVNLLFFARAPRWLERAGVEGPLFAGFLALVLVLLLGEILPKTLALRVPLLLARSSSLPLQVLVRLLGPGRRGIKFVLDLFHRALGDVARPEPGITPDVLADVLERSARAGLIEPVEADLLSEVVELGSLRVREIMTPRVDLMTIDLEDDEEERQESLRAATAARRAWMPVIRGSPDRIVGLVQVRDLLVYPERPLEQLVRPVKFVPEVARVLAVLHALREDRAGEAVVVDEWGGTAGIVTLEDIFEELVGELRAEEEGVEEPVIPLGAGRFRVSGSLSIRDWNELFGAQVVATEFETVAGFVIASLGHIPRSGDRVQLGGGLVCVVDKVRGRRIRTVDLFVELELAAREGP